MRCFPTFGCTTLPNCQLITPLVYDESLSYEQQIACLKGQMKKLTAYVEQFVPNSVFQEFVKFMEKDQNKQTEELEQYTDKQLLALKTYLISLIDQITAAMEIWDVTLGRFNNNVDSMRDLFNDVTVHAITVDTLANLDLTVDGLSECGLNVRGLAVFSGYLEGDSFVPEGVMYDGSTPVDGQLTCAILANGAVKDGFFVEGS